MLTSSRITSSLPSHHHHHRPHQQDQVQGFDLGNNYSLFILRCPLQGPARFSYDFGRGSCHSPLSNMESCTLDSRLSSSSYIFINLNVFFVIISSSSSIHDICLGRRGHCPLSKYFHVEQFCSSLKFVHALWRKIARHKKQFCSTQNILLVMWCKIALHDK